MAKKSFYDEKDIPQFQEEVCLKKCVCKGKCINDGNNNHWFLMCPHYHRWKLGYSSFVEEYLEWEREHKEEAEAKHKELVERAKAWKKAEKEKKKKSK